MLSISIILHLLSDLNCKMLTLGKKLRVPFQLLMRSEQWMLVCRTSLWQAQGNSILMLSGGGKGQSKYLSGIQLFLFYFRIQSLVRIYFQNLIY